MKIWIINLNQTIIYIANVLKYTWKCYCNSSLQWEIVVHKEPDPPKMSSLPRELYTVYYDEKNLPFDNLNVAYTTIRKSSSNEAVRAFSNKKNWFSVISAQIILLCFQHQKKFIQTSYSLLKDWFLSQYHKIYSFNKLLVNAWSSDIMLISKLTPTQVARYMFIKSLWIPNQFNVSS